MRDKSITTILEKYTPPKRENLIPILQEIQQQIGFLSKEAMIQVSKTMDIPVSKIYGVATFYNQFRFQPNGKYHIQVCRGTACHVKGSSAILDAIKRELKIHSGETTRDGLFSLAEVACIGACGSAPVICINGEFYSAVTEESVLAVIAQFRSQA